MYYLIVKRIVALALVIAAVSLWTSATDAQPFDPDSVSYRHAAFENITDVIVVIDIEETIGDSPTPEERIVKGTIVRVEKGQVPEMIVRPANVFGAGVRAGTRAKLWLMKVEGRDGVYAIILSGM